MARRMIDLTCAWCGKVNEFHDGLYADQVPKPGDVLLCWTCGRLSVVTPLHTTRRPIGGEQAIFDLDPSIIAARSAMLRERTPDAAIAAWRRTR